MILKNVIIFKVWLSSIASIILYVQVNVYWSILCIHSFTMCLIVIAFWHESHIDWGYFLIKYEKVRKDTMILMRVVAMSCRLKLEEVCHFWIVFQIFLSLLDVGIGFQWFFQDERILFLILLVDILFIVGLEHIFFT